MTNETLQTIIETTWDNRDTIGTETTGESREAVEQALEMLDQGLVRVAEKHNDQWVVNQWLKKAVLLSFRLNDMNKIEG